MAVSGARNQKKQKSGSLDTVPGPFLQSREVKIPSNQSFKS